MSFNQKGDTEIDSISYLARHPKKQCLPFQNQVTTLSLRVWMQILHK